MMVVVASVAVMRMMATATGCAASGWLLVVGGHRAFLSKFQINR
jgi:hypothetical protein